MPIAVHSRRAAWLGLLLGVLVIAGARRAVAQSATAESAALTARAADLMADDQNQAAAKLYTSAISLNPRNLAAYLGLSAVWVRLSKHLEALALLDRAESLMGWSAALGAQRGGHLSALKRWPEAERELARVLAADGAAFDAALYLGDAYLNMQQWAKAVSPLSIYLARRPASLAGQDGQVRTRLALALMQSQQFARAERELERVLAERPQDLAGRVLLGTLVARSDCKRALELLDPLLRHAREAPSIQLNRASCLLELGRLPEARRALAAYQRLRPGDAGAERLRAALEAAGGQIDAAVAAYRRALARGQPVELELAALLTRTGKVAEALDVLWPLVEKGTPSAAVLGAAAEAALTVKDAERARAAAGMLSRARPDDTGAFVLVGRAELLAELYRDAELSFTRARTLDPGDAKAVRGLRIALERQAHQRMLGGQLDVAYDLLTRANLVDPSALGVVQNLALLLLERGDARGAIDRLQPVLASLPRQQVALRVLARAHALLGERKEAQAILQRMAAAADAQPGEVAAARIDLAVFVRDSDPEAALKLLEQPPPAGADPATVAEQGRQRAFTLVLTGEDKLFGGRTEAARKDLEAARATGLLSRALEVRVRVGLALAAGVEGYRATADKLASVSDQELEAVLVPGLAGGGRDLLLLFAAYLAAERLSSSEQNKVLRDSRRLLGVLSADRSKRAAQGLLAGLLDRTLYLAAQRRQTDLVSRLRQGTPPSLQSASFQHNAVVAGASNLSAGQLDLLSDLTNQVPEARVNLAIAYEAQGDHQRALAQLRRAADGRVNVPGLREWLEWKEAVHGE